MPQFHPEPPRSIAGAARRRRPSSRSESRDHEHAGLALGLPRWPARARGRSRRSWLSLPWSSMAARGSRSCVAGKGCPPGSCPSDGPPPPPRAGRACRKRERHAAPRGDLPARRSRLLVPGDPRGDRRGGLDRHPDLDRRRPEALDPLIAARRDPASLAGPTRTRNGHSADRNRIATNQTAALSYPDGSSTNEPGAESCCRCLSPSSPTWARPRADGGRLRVALLIFGKPPPPA